MWRSLLPQGLELALDVDLAGLADRYQLSGGLIKNSILLAGTFASREGGGGLVVNRAHLERAADLQTPTQGHLGCGDRSEEGLLQLVERWPMHVSEIDDCVRQAKIQRVIRGGSGKPGLEEVREVIARRRGQSRRKVLFGGE